MCVCVSAFKLSVGARKSTIKRRSREKESERKKFTHNNKNNNYYFYIWNNNNERKKQNKIIIYFVDVHLQFSLFDSSLLFLSVRMQVVRVCIFFTLAFIRWSLAEKMRAMTKKIYSNSKLCFACFFFPANPSNCNNFVLFGAKEKKK